MVNEVADLTHNYSSLLTKVNIIVEALMQVVQWYNSMAPKLDKKDEVDDTSIGNVAKLLAELKNLMSKSETSL